MRITELQIKQIHEAIKKSFGTIDYKLFLYGSRVHDHLRGGDIDLLIVTTDEGKSLFKDIHWDLIVEIKKKPDIGQRRIDLKATTPSELLMDSFLKSIQHELVAL